MTQCWVEIIWKGMAFILPKVGWCFSKLQKTPNQTKTWKKPQTKPEKAQWNSNWIVLNFLPNFIYITRKRCYSDQPYCLNNGVVESLYVHQTSPQSRVQGISWTSWLFSIQKGPIWVHNQMSFFGHILSSIANTVLHEILEYLQNTTLILEFLEQGRSLFPYYKVFDLFKVQYFVPSTTYHWNSSVVLMFWKLWRALLNDCRAITCSILRCLSCFCDVFFFI